MSIPLVKGSVISAFVTLFAFLILLALIFGLVRKIVLTVLALGSFRAPTFRVNIEGRVVVISEIRSGSFVALLNVLVPCCNHFVHARSPARDQDISPF